MQPGPSRWSSITWCKLVLGTLKWTFLENGESAPLLNAAGLMRFPKNGGAWDNTYLVTHPTTYLCERGLISAIALQTYWRQSHRMPQSSQQNEWIYRMNETFIDVHRSLHTIIKNKDTLTKTITYRMFTTIVT
jgi:hypothetical protein